MAVQGAIAYSALQILNGRSTSIGDSLSHGMSRIGPLLGASILAGLGIGFGMFLLIIPGVILMCRWAVIMPACTIENLGALDSMGRSASLTKGYRWKILWLLIITSIISQFIVWAVALAGALFFSNSVLAGILTGLALIFPQAFSCLVTVMMYFDLRSIKDGVSVNALVNVFD